MSKQYKYYKAYGLTLASEIDLPELLPAETQEADVYIHLNDVPESIENAYKGVRFEAVKGEFLLNVDNVAKYYVSNGKSVDIQVVDGATDEEVKLFLLGSAFGALIYQRNKLPFHGSTVLVDGKAVVISGVSGAGKSTLSLNLIRKGYALISDDVSLAEIEQEKITKINPGFPRVKLWKDSLDYYEIDTNNLKRIRPGLQKYSLPIDNFSDKQAEVSHIFILRTHNSEDIIVKEIKGGQKFNVLSKNVYRKIFVKATKSEIVLFKTISLLAKQTRVYEIVHPGEKNKIEEISNLIINTVIS